MKLGLIVLLATAASIVHAQIVDGRQIVRAELITDALDVSKPFTVGIRFEIANDWYLYWKNPGDSGLPIDVTWSLPKGWKASTIQHPVPAKFTYDDMVSYGYKKKVVLLAEIIPADSATGPVGANLDWLVCKESCMRGKAEVVLPKPTGSPADRVAIEEARAKLPLAMENFPATINGGRLIETERGWMAEVQLQGPGASAVTDFFPGPTDDLLIELGSIEVRDGMIRFYFQSQQSGNRTITLPGLFIVGDKAYEGFVPINLTSM